MLVPFFLLLLTGHGNLERPADQPRKDQTPLPAHATYIVPLFPIVKRRYKRNASRQSAASGLISLVNPTKSAKSSPMEKLPLPDQVRTQSSHFLKPNLSAVSQWRSSRAAQRPSDSSSWEISHFSLMEKAMELRDWDAGSWTLMSCSIFWELGNGEMPKGTSSATN